MSDPFKQLTENRHLLSEFCFSALFLHPCISSCSSFSPLFFGNSAEFLQAVVGLLFCFSLFLSCSWNFVRYPILSKSFSQSHPLSTIGWTLYLGMYLYRHIPMGAFRGRRLPSAFF